MAKYSWFDDRADKLRADATPAVESGVPVNAAGLELGYSVTTLALPTLPNYGNETLGDGPPNLDEWAFCDDGSVLYLLGGYVRGVTTNDSLNSPYLLRLNLATFTWLEPIDLPETWANEGGWARYLDGVVYFGGGDGEGGATSAWALNTTTLAFTQLADSPCSVDYGSVALADGGIYVISDDGTSVALYDPNTDTWEPLADLPSLGQEDPGSDPGYQVGRTVFWPIRNLRLDLDADNDPWSLIVTTGDFNDLPNEYSGQSWIVLSAGTDLLVINDTKTWILDGLTGTYTTVPAPVATQYQAGAVRGGVFFLIEERGVVRRWTPTARRPAAFQAGRLEVGSGAVATGKDSAAEGSRSTATGDRSHAEGSLSVASGANSHAEGSNAVASGAQSHAEGADTVASGDQSHVEGQQSVASGRQAHAEGFYTKATGDSSHAENNQTHASGSGSHAEGANTFATGYSSHAEGSNTTASGSQSHAEGVGTVASGNSSHAQGQAATASGDSSHAEGWGSFATGFASHAEGQATASGTQSHAEGGTSVASGINSHAEGQGTAAGDESHAEGGGTVASGIASHAEGFNTQALGESSHAQGFGSVATADKSHAEGLKSDARNHSSHAHGGPTFTADGIGESQYMRNQLGSQSSFATPSAMTLPDGLEAKLAPNRAAVVRALVIARDQAGSAAAGWTVTGVVRVDGSGNGTLVGSATVTKVAGDSGTSGWAVALSAQADSIVRITVTGPGDATLHWSANLEWQEIS